MTDILKRFSWWEWAVIALNFVVLIAELAGREYADAIDTSAILILFTTCAAWRSMYSMLEDENNAFRRDLGIPVWK